ncbi:methionyl-tRNA formyltransferase [Flavobacterium sp. NRK F7]|uniref:methionyl-tRNA formyltransferase n=1 Tax=Flavobacterium sp. NRK F7 TaxID=2954930 RepID=UPI00209197F4|nr:formyltransferase family protein [Flavobacterium sp. NRK F7]MCO6164025.1 methionyl-tRNA formyltransferase [Flavobacterium sp. NRK F7]
MENNVKIVLLCGGRFAFPALQLLAFEKFLHGVAIGKASENIVDALENECANNQIKFKHFPNKAKIGQMKDWIHEIKPDFIFSISFPFLIPEDVLAYGTEKFINFHPGPLPQYRGVMPIFEVLKNQESHTAICAHFMNANFDEGDIIFNDPILINENETYGSLTVKLSNRVGQVALNMANMLQFANSIPRIVQDEDVAYYYEKPTLSDTYINWKRMDAAEIVALINACNPWNTGADTTFIGNPAKLIDARIINKSSNQNRPGTIIEILDENEICIATVDNKQIAVTILQTQEGIQTVKQLHRKLNLMNLAFN